MRLETQIKKGKMTINTIIYDDVYGVSEYFEPKVWIDFWSDKKKYFIKTLLGEKIELYEDDLRKLNLKLHLIDIGTGGNVHYKHIMTVNSPRRAASRIPLLSISKNLNKIWRGCINVEREYEKRWDRGYRYWCPEGIDE